MNTCARSSAYLPSSREMTASSVPVPPAISASVASSWAPISRIRPHRFSRSVSTASSATRYVCTADKANMSSPGMSTDQYKTITIFQKKKKTKKKNITNI